jgi:3',5'-cyclic AMP phosphodiesterase CpdA
MKLSRRQFLGLMGALGLSACARVKIPLVGGPEKGPFTVAAMNDLHVSNAGSTAIVNHAIEKINAAANVRFTVILGDLSTSGQLTELNLAKKSLDRLAKPYLVVPGNHDVDPKAENPYANYEKNFHRGNWTREEGAWVFIGFDSCEGGGSDVTIRPDRIKWLKERLNDIKRGRPIGLFCHHPLNPHSKAYRVKNADAVLALFAGHNLKLAASGHYHGNQVEEENGVLFVTTACCSSTRTNFDDTTAKGVRLFHFDGEKIQTEFVVVEG